MADPLEVACSLVGRFQYHFGRLEKKIDEAVIKLLELDDKASLIVLANVDFVKKLNFVATAAHEQQSLSYKDKKFAKKTCNDVKGINDPVRQTVIHSSFEPASGGGVQFKRTTARGHIDVLDPLWTDNEFSKHYKKMKELEEALEKLIQLVKPIPFDWFQPLAVPPKWQGKSPARVLLGLDEPPS
jgi:hypothetical protein